MRMKMSLAVMTTLAAFAAPARAQVRALPSVMHAQYGVPVLPCVEKPIPQPEQGAEGLPYDGGCDRAPVEPPVVQPDPLPCMDGGCVTPPPHHPEPDPCWWDDCKNGGGLGGRYRIQKEALRGGDIAAKQGALNALFDNMSGKASADAAVYVGRVAAGRGPFTPAIAADSGAATRRAVRFVPAPEIATEKSPEGASWSLIGAGMIAISGLLFGRRKEPQMVLASDEEDEHTDRNSQRNNPQRDPDVERGWNENQARHRDEQTVKDSSGTVTNGDNWTNGNSVPPLNGGGRAAPPPRWTPPVRPGGR